MSVVKCIFEKTSIMCPPPCGPRRSPRRSRNSNPSYKYAALFKIGYLEVKVSSNTLVGLIDELWKSQDLSCLSRQARLMGNSDDCLVAENLDLFLEKYYSETLRSRDIRNLSYDFSIGSLVCQRLLTSKEEITAFLAG